MIIEYYGVEDNFCEWNYIQSVLNNLSFSNDYKVHIVSVTQEWDYRDKVVLDTDKRNIIIGLADEFMTDNIPQNWKDNATVFKAYLLPEQEIGNVHSFPLGHNKKHISLENKPIADRPVDVFFSGHMASTNRQKYLQPVIKFFSDMSQDQRPNLDINITTGFNRGYSGEEYSRRLHDAKIVVCPAGNVSMETFRHYEALRSGAVIVSPKLPETAIYKNCYIKQVEDWDNECGDVIMDLLKDLDMLQLVQDKQNKDYESRYSPKAVAKYIEEQVIEDTYYEFLSTTK